MFIAIVDFTVAAANRAAALAELLTDADAVRAMKGNIGFRCYLDPVMPEALCIVHEWQDAEAFAAYTNSRYFARLNAVLRPMMTSRPISRRMKAALIETV